MAELGFILSKEEEEGLVVRALDASAWLVPDIDHQAPEPLRVTTLREYEECRKSTRMFFIQHPSYVKGPLEMREALKDGKRVFFVMQRNGGPAIEFMSSVEFAEGGRAKINPGFLGHHKTFWNPATQRNEEMPTDLLRLYRELSTEVKRMATREKVGVRTYWIGNVIQDRINTGSLRLGMIDDPAQKVVTQ